MTNYTDRDFSALQTRLRGLALTLFPDWPVDRAAAFSNFVLDSFAFVGDVLNYYNDANYRESFISEAKLLQSVLYLARGLGVDLPLQEAATADLLVTLPNARAVDVPLAVGTRVSTEGENAVEFRIATAGTIPAGSISASVSVENTKGQEETVSPTGEAWWSVWLSAVPYIRVVSVVDALGFAWTEQSTLVRSVPGDRNFEVVVNAAGRAQLRFGDGVLGMVPDQPLTVVYDTGGGGGSNNVAKNTIKVVLDTVRDVDGVAVPVVVTNPDAASGGNDRVSAEQAGRMIPESFRAQNRSVSNADFVAHAEEVTGVARALMLTSNEDPGLQENEGHLLVVPEGGGVPSAVLKAAVLAKVTTEKPGPITFLTTVMDPQYLAVNLSVKVYRQPGQVVATLGETLRANLAELFSITRKDGTKNMAVNFGGGYVTASGGTDSSLPFSDVFNCVRDSEGVRKLGTMYLNGVSGDVVLRPREFPTLGSVTLVDGDTGLSF
jgi:hypothetical protein